MSFLRSKKVQVFIISFFSVVIIYNFSDFQLKVVLLLFIGYVMYAISKSYKIIDDLDKFLTNIIKSNEDELGYKDRISSVFSPFLKMIFILFFVGLSFFFLYGNDNPFAAFGDSIGGLLNPVLSFLGLLIISVSIIVQIDELKSAKSEIATNNELMKKSNLLTIQQQRLDTMQLFVNDFNEAKVSSKKRMDSLQWSLLNKNSEIYKQTEKWVDEKNIGSQSIDELSGKILNEITISAIKSVLGFSENPNDFLVTFKTWSDVKNNHTLFTNFRFIKLYMDNLIDIEDDFNFKTYSILFYSKSNSDDLKCIFIELLLNPLFLKKVSESGFLDGGFWLEEACPTKLQMSRKEAYLAAITNYKEILEYMELHSF